MAELDTTTVETDVSQESENATESAEIARLRAELAKQIDKNDRLSKENADKTKALRAKQTAEEAAAEEARVLAESMQEELKQLRKEKAVAATTAKLVSFVGNQEVAEKLSQYLYGAEDIESALTEINKAWTAKEKALRLEFGKIPAPSAGSSEGSMISKAQLDAMGYKERAKFFEEHPDEYNKLMGR